MPEREASVAPSGGERNGSDSLTDAGADGKLTECRGVARGEVRLADISIRAEKRCKLRGKEPLVRVRTAGRRMKNTSQRIVLSVLCAAMALPAAGQAQTPAQVQTQAPPPAARPRHRAAPPSAVTVDGSEAMFATMCALVAAGFESNVSADHWTAFRAQMRERLRRQQGPAVDALREFYKQHELQDAVSQVVFVSTAYLREILDASHPETFTIVVEPLVGRITNVRNFGDHYALVLSGGEEIPTDVLRHAFLHFLLDR